ncbi:MAG: hypothetical protein JNL36_07625 [Candidatus Kapabacteria bacterium]|nr:hypothetical protein [Candidatus Kapabacteria bacterium]
MATYFLSDAGGGNTDAGFDWQNLAREIYEQVEQRFLRRDNVPNGDGRGAGTGTGSGTGTTPRGGSGTVPPGSTPFRVKNVDMPYDLAPSTVDLVIQRNVYETRKLGCEEFLNRTPEQDKYLRQNTRAYKQLNSLCNNSYDPEIEKIWGIRKEFFWGGLGLALLWMFVIPNKGKE